MAGKYPTTWMCDGELLERFEPTVRDSDVFIATSAKCGQTWLQTLLFHLKTKGKEEDFRGVGLHGVSPWLELPTNFGEPDKPIDRDGRMAELEALDDPRVFKMHVIWEEIPRPAGSKAKVMTITRDPRDVPYSMFCHLHAMKHREGEGPPANFDDYFEGWMEFGFYFKFVAGFWPHKNDDDVMWLRYEDMQSDLRGQTERIVEFLGWDVTENDIDRVLPLVDFQRMRASEKGTIMRKTGRWKDDGYFFRQGSVGKNRLQLSPDQERRIVDRIHAELPADCARFVLTLPDRE